MSYLEDLKKELKRLCEVAPEDAAEEGVQEGLDLPQTFKWREARAKLLDAKIHLLEVENSFLKAPLDERARDQMWGEIEREVYSSATGDGQDEDNVEREYHMLSDWEFKRQYDNVKRPMYEGRPVYEKDEVEPDDEGDSSQDER